MKKLNKFQKELLYAMCENTLKDMGSSRTRRFSLINLRPVKASDIVDLYDTIVGK